MADLTEAVQLLGKAMRGCRKLTGMVPAREAGVTEGGTPMRRKKLHCTEDGTKSTGLGVGSGRSRNIATSEAVVRAEDKLNLITALWIRLTNPFLRLRLVWLHMRVASAKRRLRRQGIDPDTIPEIMELRRRYEQKQREHNSQAE